MYDASVAIDFSPLSKIGDHFVAQRERARDSELLAQATAADTAPAGPQVAAAAGGASQPAAPRTPSFAGGTAAMAMPSDPKIEAIALETAKKYVGDNPYALAAFAAHGQGESAFSPSRIVGSWSDPSQSGQPGTSGGALSWRNERYANMKQATASAGQDPYAATAAQTDFAFTENPGLTQRLRASQSLPEAFSLFAASQRYAGWNDPNSPENAKRIQMAQGYLQRLQGLQAGGQSAPQAPQGGATAAPAGQVAQMPAASETQPAASPGQNPAKRAALIQLLNSANPAMRETARFLLTDMRKDDNWQITEQAGQKFFYNTRTRQVVPSGLPADRFTQETLPDGRLANRGANNKLEPMPEAKEPRESVDDKIRIAAAGKAETKVDTQLNPIVKALGDDFEKQLTAARAAPNRIEAAHETRRAIENGAITGLFSGGRLNGAKLAELFGLGDGAATSTETLRAALGNKVLENIKMLTPASNSDVKYLERVKGGTTELEASTLIELAKMEERAARKAIANFNNIGAAYRSKMPKQLEGYEAMMNVAEPGSYEDYVRANPSAPTQAAGQPNPVRGFTNVLPQGGISGTIPGTNIPFSLKPTAR